METDSMAFLRKHLPPPSDKEALEAIAKGADVSYHTLLKIAKGETSDPRVSTVDSLTRYFRDREAA